MKLFSLEMDSTVFKSGEFLTKFGHKVLLSLSPQPDCVKVLEKIFARTLCFIHQGIFRPNYILNNDAYFFLDFREQKFPLIFFNLNPF